MKKYLQRILKMRWAQHLVFWVFSVLAISSYFSISNELLAIDLIYSLCFHVCLVSLVYVLLQGLIPYLLDEEKFLLFLVGMICNVFLSIGIHELIFEFVVPLFLSGFYIVSFTDINQLIFIFSFYSIIVLLIHLSKSYFKVQQMQKDKLELELSALKNQLNPHFLFNGLNSIYAFSLKGDKRASESILKLSELLRYVLYEVSKEKVPVIRELHLIQLYIDLQKMRIRDLNNIGIKTNESGNPSIVPMLLFPLVENAFKHGNITEPGSYIKIQADYTQQHLTFNCENTFGNREPSNGAASGIGLESVSKMLSIAYGKNAKLLVHSENHIHSATLTINF